MKTFDCTVLVDASYGYSVQAENAEDASNMAELQASEDGVGHLCHQCSDRLTTGDIYAVLVHDESGKEVYSTDFRDLQLAELRAAATELLQALKKARWEDPERDRVASAYHELERVLQH